jgi:hypothetical protein
MFLSWQLDNCILLELGIRQPIISFCLFSNLWHWLCWNTCFPCYTLNFWLLMQSIVLLWAHLSAQSLHYPICKAKYWWGYIDTQFHDGVTYMLCTVSNRMAATTLLMNYYHIVTVRLPKIKHQASLRLHWRSFSGWERERVGIIFNSKGSQYQIYTWHQPIAA